MATGVRPSPSTDTASSHSLTFFATLNREILAGNKCPGFYSSSLSIVMSSGILNETQLQRIYQVNVKIKRLDRSTLVQQAMFYLIPINVCGNETSFY